MSTTTDKFTIDPEKGYNRYSYSHRPPDLPGFKIIHVRPHMRNGRHIKEHWFYSRVDANGRQLRGKTAAAKMAALGIGQTSAPPEVLKEQPSRIGQIMANRAEYNRNRSTTKKRRLARRSPLITQQPQPAPVREHVASSDVNAYWVPVKGVDERFHGWIDISKAMLVQPSQLTPIGLGGKLDNSTTLMVSGNYSQTLDVLKSKR